MGTIVRKLSRFRIRWSFALISFLALLLSGPLLVVLSAPLHTAAPEWEHVWRVMLAPQLVETSALLGIALLTGLVLAVPSAWFIATLSFSLRRIFGLALVLPLAMPTYIAAYTYAALLGPTGGITRWCVGHLGIRPDVMNLPGLGVVLGLVLYPYIYLPVRAMFTRGMVQQLEAARMLGAGSFRSFVRIGIPLARPAIAAGSLLLGMEVLNDYGAVKYYGIRTLTTGIFRSWGGLYDLGSALRLGMVLLVLVAVLLWIERRSRRGILHATEQVPGRRRDPVGIEKWVALTWCSVVLFFAAVLPLGNLIADAASTWKGAGDDGIMEAFGNTLLVASLSGVVTLFIAMLFAYRERHGRRSDLAIRAASLGYAIPGAVIAIGTMTLAGPIDRSSWGGPMLIGGFGLLVYAFAVRFLAVGTQPLFGNLKAQPRSLDDAARLLGASTWRTFRTINLPLLRPAMLAAGMLVAIDVVKELPLTLILRPFNFETLSTKAYSLASIEQLREAAWPALLIVLCASVPLLLLERTMARAPR